MAHTDPKETCLLKHPAKTPQRGLVWEQGLFPYPSGESPTQAHTGGTAGTIQLCCLLVFGISSFSGPIPKVLFFVYAAQFLHRADPPTGYSNNVLQNVIRVLWKPFCFLRCDRMCFPQAASKLPQIAVDLVSGRFFYPDRESLTQAHTAGHAGRSCFNFAADIFSLCTSRDIFSNCCW